MATVVRNTDASVALWAAAINDVKAQIGAGANFHLDASERTITAANATDLPTSLVLVNQIAAIYTFHAADTVAHKASGNPLTVTTAAVDLTTANALANDVKAKWATHIASTSQHYTADAVNTTSAANATDLTTLMALLNEMKGDFNAHVASAPAAKSIRVVPA